MDKKKQELLIIIPAYNEAKTIGGLLDKLEEAGITNWADLLVMNDASSDGVHLNKAYMQIWADHIFNIVSGVL